MIAKYIHSILDNNKNLPENARGNVQLWASDDDTPWEAKFPMITHIDLSSAPLNNSLGIWRADYQVSVWTKTKLEGKEIIKKILEILNRYSDANIEAISVQSINASYDAESGTNGTHARFSVVFREFSV